VIFVQQILDSNHKLVILSTLFFDFLDLGVIYDDVNVLYNPYATWNLVRCLGLLSTLDCYDRVIRNLLRVTIEDILQSWVHAKSNPIVIDLIIDPIGEDCCVVCKWHVPYLRVRWPSSCELFTDPVNEDSLYCSSVLLLPQEDGAGRDRGDVLIASIPYLMDKLSIPDSLRKITNLRSLRIDVPYLQRKRDSS
jgi:hypothetical protein